MCLQLWALEVIPSSRDWLKKCVKGRYIDEPAYAKMVRSRKHVSRSTGGNSNVRDGRGAKGGGTPRFTYDKKRGVYIYKKQGGSLFGSIKRGLTKIVPKMMKAAKPLSRAIAAKGLKAAKNPRNRRRLMMIAARN